MVNCFLSWRFYNCLQVWNSTLFFLRNFFAKKFITFWSVLYLKILLKSLRSRQKKISSYRSFPNPAGYHFHGCFCFIPNWYDCGLSDYIFVYNVEKNGGMIRSCPKISCWWDSWCNWEGVWQITSCLPRQVLFLDWDVLWDVVKGLVVWSGLEWGSKTFGVHMSVMTFLYDLSYIDFGLGQRILSLLVRLWAESFSCHLSG